jgi:hypothetical protein
MEETYGDVGYEVERILVYYFAGKQSLSTNDRYIVVAYQAAKLAEWPTIVQESTTKTVDAEYGYMNNDAWVLKNSQRSWWK